MENTRNTATNGEINLDQIITLLEIVEDQLKDQRYKLQVEITQNRAYDWIKFRVGTVTHYRNIKLKLLASVDKSQITRREIIGLLYSN